MKKVLTLIFFCAYLLPTKAQTVYDYVLTPISATLQPNETMHLAIKKLDSTGDRPQEATDVGITETPHWMLNGSANANASEGTLLPDLTFLNATYTAPAQAPAKNPVAVAVQFHPKKGSKQLVTLICNVKIVSAKYKVVMDGEITGPKGIHYKLHGESYRNLQSFADGTAALVSYDGSKKLHVNVSAAGVPGKMWLVNPLEYDIPVVFNIGNTSKSSKVPASISIETFSPSKMGRNEAENYWTPVGIKSFPGNISHMFEGTFYEIAMSTANENGSKANHDLAFAKRLQAHEGDASYFKTAQGKADLLEMQKHMQEHGHGNIYRGTRKPPLNSNAYSKAFVEGMRKTQSDPSSYGTPPDKNNPTIMGGILHFQSTFDTKNKTATNIFEETNTGGLHGRINIYVKKL
ncbi:MAG: hypothetical protein ACTHNG_13820 [Ginsengibacter sp.]